MNVWASFLWKLPAKTHDDDGELNKDWTSKRHSLESMSIE